MSEVAAAADGIEGDERITFSLMVPQPLARIDQRLERLDDRFEGCSKDMDDRVERLDGKVDALRQATEDGIGGLRESTGQKIDNMK